MYTFECLEFCIQTFLEYFNLAEIGYLHHRATTSFRFGQYRTSSSPPISNSNGSGLDLALAVGPAGTKGVVAALSACSKEELIPAGCGSSVSSWIGRVRANFRRLQ